MNRKAKAVALVSGGMDSLVSLAEVIRTHKIAALHMMYGQRTENRELEAFNSIAAHYSIEEKMVCSLDALNKIGGSSLTEQAISVSDANLESTSIPTSYVPFRNAHFLASAVSWAEVIGADTIAIGAVAEDSSGYPDCKREFYDAFEKLIETGTKPETSIKVITPVIKLSKQEIIKRAVELEAPLNLTWSCYKNSDKACGICDSCALRLRAFRQAGIEDPVPYVVRPEY